MRTAKFETPAVYGDHHVKEVRRILSQIEGVQEIYASSAFHIVEVTYDESRVTEAELAAQLTAAGYFGEFAFAEEKGVPASLESERGKSFFRHTQVFETTREVVGFSQKVGATGRPLWNCPGFGVIKNRMED